MSFALGDIDRRSQMRVANILTCLKWEKVGQQQHLGKRQVVWKVTTPPDGIAEVLQQQTQSGQGIATPSIPSIPNPNTTSDSVKTEKEQVNKKVRVKSDDGIVNPQSQSGQRVEAARPSDKSPAIPVDWQSYPYNSIIVAIAFSEIKLILWGKAKEATISAN